MHSLVFFYGRHTVFRRVVSNYDSNLYSLINLCIHWLICVLISLNGHVILYTLNFMFSYFTPFFSPIQTNKPQRKNQIFQKITKWFSLKSKLQCEYIFWHHFLHVIGFKLYFEQILQCYIASKRINPFHSLWNCV